MKIYFIVKNAYPYGKATAARVYNYAKGFHELQIPCEVLIPISIERHNKKPCNTEKEGYYKGTYFKYITKNPQRHKNGIIRKFSDIAGYLSTLRYIIRHVSKEDIVLIYEGGVLWHYMVAAVTHLKKAHVVMELNELPYGTGQETKTTEMRRKQMLAYVFPKYDGFIAISEALKKLAESHSKREILKVPILVSSELSGEIAPELGEYIFYSGSLSEQKDGVLGMLAGFGIAKKDPVCCNLKFFLTGQINDSPHAMQIKELLKEYGIESDVCFLGYLNNHDLRKYQRNCLLTIINKYPTQQNAYCFSTKLGEYLAFSRPVITTNVGEAGYYLENGKNAFIVEPCKPALLAEKIIYIITHREASELIGDEGSILTHTTFNYRYQTQRIINYFKNIIAETPLQKK